MGFFDFGSSEQKTMEINYAVSHAPAGAVFLDVRDAQEYARGHIPGSINMPVMAIRRIGKKVPDKSAPIFVYCRSGKQSSRAALFLLDEGYKDVTNIGGLASYKGPLETL